MSLCPSSHLLSSILQFDVQFLCVFPVLSIPLLSAGQQWMSFQFLPRAVSCRDQLLDDRQVSCCHLHGLASPSCLLWTCFLCLCQKREERTPPENNLSAKPPTHGLLLALGSQASPCFSPWWQQAESQSCGWDKQQDPAFLEQERDLAQQQGALGDERLDPGGVEDAEDVCAVGAEQCQHCSCCCSCPFWWL